MKLLEERIRDGDCSGDGHPTAVCREREVRS